MKQTIITVTEAARNFDHYINRVHNQNRSFVLVKNGKPLARLVPANDRICTGAELTKALALAKLSPTEASAWRKDLLKARKTLKPVENASSGFPHSRIP